jgi:hypothetical protein
MTTMKPLSPLQIATINHPILNAITLNSPATPISPNGIASALKEGNKAAIDRAEAWVESKTELKPEEVDTEIWNNLTV